MPRNLFCETKLMELVCNNEAESCLLFGQCIVCVLVD